MTDQQVTTNDIAQRLGVKPRTVHRWRLRNLGFPQPNRYYETIPVWLWPDVERWAKNTGRL